MGGGGVEVEQSPSESLWWDLNVSKQGDILIPTSNIQMVKAEAELKITIEQEEYYFSKSCGLNTNTCY